MPGEKAFVSHPMIGQTDMVGSAVHPPINKMRLPVLPPPLESLWLPIMEANTSLMRRNVIARSIRIAAKEQL